MKILLLSICLVLAGCGKKSRSVKPITKSEQDQIVTGFLADRSQQCEKFKTRIPKDFVQGTIEVPEDPSSPKGRHIKVFYYGKLIPGKTPAVFFNGGPGGSSWSSYLYMKDKNASMIYIDQRGNGCSDFYPIGDDDETIDRLRHYGSRGIVADAEAVRKLIYPKKPWIAFGQSYGGFIVHRYVTTAPSGIKAGISHGNAINDDGFARIKARVASYYRVIKTYLKKYPEDKERIRILSRDLTYDTCISSGDDSACGYQLLQSIPSYLAFTDTWPLLHQELEKLVPKDKIDWNAMDEWARYEVFNGSSPYQVIDMSYYVISHVDRNVPNLSQYNCTRIRDELMATGLDISRDPLHECASQLQYPEKAIEYANPLAHLKTDYIKMSSFAEALRRQPQIRFYLYSGENDQTVPRENFEEEVNMLGGAPNFSYTNFPESGHDGFATEPLVWQVLNNESREVITNSFY